MTAIAASTGGIIGALNVLMYVEDRGKCDEVPRAELEALSVKLPGAVKACAVLGNRSDVQAAEYRLIVRPGAVSIVTSGVLGSTSTSDVGLSLLMTMTSASWGTGTLHSEEDTGNWEFVRRDGRTSIHLSRDREGGLSGTATMQVRRYNTDAAR